MFDAQQSGRRQLHFPDELDSETALRLGGALRAGQAVAGRVLDEVGCLPARMRLAIGMVARSHYRRLARMV